MEVYNRYIDQRNRLFVVISRRATPEIVEGVVHLKDRKIELLDVHAEKILTVLHEEMQAYIDQRKLTQLTTKS